MPAPKDNSESQCCLDLAFLDLEGQPFSVF